MFHSHSSVDIELVWSINFFLLYQNGHSRDLHFGLVISKTCSYFV